MFLCGVERPLCRQVLRGRRRRAGQIHTVSRRVLVQLNFAGMRKRHRTCKVNVGLVHLNYIRVHDLRECERSRYGSLSTSPFWNANYANDRHSNYLTCIFPTCDERIQSVSLQQFSNGVPSTRGESTGVENTLLDTTLGQVSVSHEQQRVAWAF